MKSGRTKVVLATVTVVFVFGVIMILTRGDRSRDLVLSIEPIDQSGEVTVYVDGAVEGPGLYSLPRGSRVSEALDLAGPLDDADTSSLQLARVLEDEQSIQVPTRSASVDDAAPAETAPNAADGGRIDINQATESELEQLPGIGPALAERITERRNLEGPYRSIDELSDVSGISERMVDDLRELATTGQ